MDPRTKLTVFLFALLAANALSEGRQCFVSLLCSDRLRITWSHYIFKNKYVELQPTMWPPGHF